MARTAAQTLRIYGPPERREWVTTRACFLCWAVPSVNAHIGSKGAGMGRKADYDQIAPICARCHGDIHQGRIVLTEVQKTEWPKMTEERWQIHLASVG